MMQGNDELLIQKQGDLKQLLAKVMVDVPFLPTELLNVMEQRQIKRYPVYKKIADGLMHTQKMMGKGMFKMALKTFRMPTLILWGDTDPVFDVRVTKELEENIKYTKTVILNNVGHVPIFEAPKESANAYLTFLADLKRV